MYKIQKTRIIGPKPDWVFPCGFFYGASAANIGGSGFMIYLNETHYFSFAMSCGRCTNTRAELLALWATLRVCWLMGLPIKLIYGDSSIIISWLNGFSALDVPALMHWCGDIKKMLLSAPHVIFKHIYREHNSLADGLSKEAIILDMGHGSFTESLDGLVINDGHFELY